MPLILPLLFVGAVSGDLKPAEIAKRTIPAVVVIRAQTAEGELTGTGFIVDASGTIITNLHVIEGASALAIKAANGDVYDQVRVRAYDQRKDLAVIQIAGYRLPTVPLGDSDEVAIGDPVLLIGNPLGLEASVSSGIVSAVRESRGFRVIQTDAAANAGNSGGPLLNARGEVIGVLSFKLKGAESLNFVVPANYAQGLLAEKASLTLRELSRRLGASEIDLFSDRLLPSVWREVADGTRREVKLHDGRIYVEVLMPQDLAHLWRSAADLERKGEAWVGVWRATLVCNRLGKQCSIGPLPFVISSLSRHRIEGWYEQLSLGRDGYDCDTCRVMKPTVRHEFVWVPE